MYCISTAIILAMALIAAAVDLRVILLWATAFRRRLSPDLPASLRRLLWQQHAWISFPVAKVGGLLFWLALAFVLACQLARQVMAP